MKHRIFFICSTVIEVTQEIAYELVKSKAGRFREGDKIMDDALFGSGVSVLGYQTYYEWKEDNQKTDHVVVGDFNVVNKVRDKLEV